MSGVPGLCSGGAVPRGDVPAEDGRESWHPAVGRGPPHGGLWPSAGRGDVGRGSGLHPWLEAPRVRGLAGLGEFLNHQEPVACASLTRLGNSGVYSRQSVASCF